MTHRHEWCDVKDQEFANTIYKLANELNIALSMARDVQLICGVKLDGLGGIAVKVDRSFYLEEAENE